MKKKGTISRKHLYIKHTPPVTPIYKIIVDTERMKKDIEVNFNGDGDIEVITNLADDFLKPPSSIKVMVLHHGWNIYQKEKNER